MIYLSDFKTSYPKRRCGYSKKRACGVNWFYGILDEYCRNSTLHGLRYLREPGLSRSDRMFWFIIVLSSLFVSGFVIYILYQNGTDRFEMSFDPISTPIWDIPFPTILVCPLFTVRKTFFDLEKHPNNKKYQHYSKLICPAKEEFNETFNTPIEDEFFTFLTEGAIPCEELMINCVWSRKEVDCCTIFKPIITGYGLCYIFNNLPGDLISYDYRPPPGTEYIPTDESKYWDIDTGYPSRIESPSLVLPYWAELPGELAGLTVELVDNHKEWQQHCSGGQTGYEIKVLSPLEVPETVTGVKIANNVHTHFVVTPTLIHSNSDLLSIAKDARGCVFQDEYTLEYFKVYTQSGCYMECFLKMVRDQCDCVPYSLHRMSEFWNRPFCNDEKTLCTVKALERLIHLAMTERDKTKGCLCIPACSELHFDFQSNSHRLMSSSSVPPWASNYNATSEPSISRVSVYFSVQQFTALIRQKTSSMSDFLGNCGGLLGLVIGFSFISAFEVFYFLFIRPFNKFVMFCVTYQAK